VRRIAIERLAAFAAFVLLAGCRGAQSALDSKGPVAGEIEKLWWFLLAVSAAALVLILGLLLWAVFRRHDRALSPRQQRFVLLGGIVLPAFGLIALLIYGTAIGGRIVLQPETPTLRIDVTGHQWWWEVHYPADGGQPAFTTANELHLPVGVPVEIELRSTDVIHSFWIPSLGGKLDMVPGRTHTLRLEAARPEVMRGQCSEFCGAQHALMSFGVVAEPPESFDAWRRSRAAGASPPESPLAAQGLEAFVEHRCAECHRVAGLLPDSGDGDPLTGIRGPDLTHVASRPTIAARTLPYGRANVERWIRENHLVKPGNRMPSFDGLPDETVLALVEFVDRLR
jgi:cytochrome c oxidase subunit II